METLYIIRASNCIKVGITSNLKQRMQMIQTSCPFPITILRIYYNFNDLNYRHIEKTIHNRFKLYKLSGEWFTYVDDFEITVHEFILQNYNIDFKILNKPFKEKMNKPFKEKNEKRKKQVEQYQDIVNYLSTEKAYTTNDLKHIIYDYLYHKNIEISEIDRIINQDRITGILKIIKPYFSYKRHGEDKAYRLTAAL